MLKTIAAFLVLVYFVDAQCPAGSTNNINGYSTRYCYRYLGKSRSYNNAVQQCKSFGLPLVTPKTDAGLNDLYKLYKAYDNFYFWNTDKV